MEREHNGPFVTKLGADPRLPRRGPGGLPRPPAPFIRLLIHLFSNGLLIMPTAHQAHCTSCGPAWLSLSLGLPVPKERNLCKTVRSLDTVIGAGGQLPHSQQEPCVQGAALDRESSSRCPLGQPQGLEPGQGRWQGTGKLYDVGRTRAVPKGTSDSWQKP